MLAKSSRGVLQRKRKMAAASDNTGETSYGPKDTSVLSLFHVSLLAVLSLSNKSLVSSVFAVELLCCIVS